MRHLLDTHVLIWFINGNNELSKNARNAIESESALNFVSIASLWEMAIKISLGRLDLFTPFEQIEQQIINNNFKILSTTFQDTLTLSSLPFYHRDPFDRMIISQSITNNLSVISKDKFFGDYKIELIW